MMSSVSGELTSVTGEAVQAGNEYFVAESQQLHEKHEDAPFMKLHLLTE